MATLVDTTGSVGEFVAQFRKRVIERRVPLSGMVEITSRCNLRCVHCYLGPQEEQQRKRASEMSTAEVTALIDQMADAGTMDLTITGGDPMMRPDFPDIYRHVKQRGIEASVFCDGVLVTDRIIELFREYPPALVEVSIYGATAETYESITRVPGSFPKFLAGVRRLLAAEVKTGLKSVLMTLNRHEFAAMEKMVRDWGVPFRFDSAIFPCLPDSGKKPLDLRVDPAEAVALEMASPQRMDEWVGVLTKQGNQPPQPELYQCGAGLTNFYVDPFGDLSPCLMTTRYRYSVRGPEAFAATWRDDVGRMRRLRPENPDYACNSCAVRVACSGCPAAFVLETGREDVKSGYVCQTTQLRVRAIKDEIERREGRTYLRVVS